MITKKELALSKLTAEEKELLGLVKKEVKPKIKRNYKLNIKYMIGDANGYTNEEATISVDNPFVKMLTNALDRLKIPSSSWGLVLNDDSYDDNYKNKNINKLEYDLLCLVSGYSYDEEAAIEFFKEHGFENTEINHKYLQDFDGLLKDETEYSFLVYQRYKLK